MPTTISFMLKDPVRSRIAWPIDPETGGSYPIPDCCYIKAENYCELHIFYAQDHTKITFELLLPTSSFLFDSFLLKYDNFIRANAKMFELEHVWPGRCLSFNETGWKLGKK